MTLFAAMNRSHGWILLVLVLPLFAFVSDLEIYRLYRGKKETSAEKMMKAIEEADVVFFGELHNNAVCHFFEMEVLKSLHKAHGSNLVVGCEMFESDDQLAVDEYLAGMTNDAKFEENARVWPNYKTDYKAIVQYAKKEKIPFIATNVPRRYASLVFQKGFEGLDGLSAEAKSYIAPLPILYDTTVACYNNLLHSNMGGHMSANMPKAQALKDATMAHFILKNLKEGKKFYHFNGAYHSNNHEGIVWYLKQAKPDLKITVISTAEQADLSKPDSASQNLGDYLLLVNENFPKTH
ncbi:MAG: iron-regulated protein [Bacteroidetes bacterium]|nr:MAG: iron-regulated protein [Bacteroidota bacterium]